MTLIEALSSGKWFVGAFKPSRFRFNKLTGKCEAQFENTETDNYGFTPREILNTSWELEPCKHEPKIDQSKIIFFQGKTEVKSQPIGEPWFYPECKHCGVKIQAKEWTAV